MYSYQILKIKKIVKQIVFFILSFFIAVDYMKAEERTFELLAKVNNEVITKMDVEDRFKIITKTSKISYTKRDEQYIRDRILIQMVEELLKIKKADELGIKITDNEIKVAVKHMEEEQGLAEGYYYKILKKNNLSKSSWNRQVKAELLWQQIIYREILPRVKVETFEIEEAIDYMMQDAERNKFKLAEIYIPIYYSEKKSNRQEVESFVNNMVKDLKNKGNFREMVRQFSRSSTASKDGELGWIDENVLSEQISNELKKTGKGNVTNPIFIGNEKNGGYYIFQLQDMKKEKSVGENDRKNLENFIYRNKLEVEFKQYLADLYKNNFVEFCNTCQFQIFR